MRHWLPYVETVRGERLSMKLRKFANGLKPCRRERRVMLQIATGKINKQIAGDLGLSDVTVKVHRRAAMRKNGRPDSRLQVK